MQPHVCFEMVITSESLVTNLTFKRFLSSVGSFMVLQDMLVAKRSVANLAREDLIAAVLVGGR